jgi:hypothetical protein
MIHACVYNIFDEEVPVIGQKPGSREDRFLSSKWSNELIYKDKSPDQFSHVKCVFEGKYTACF